MLVSWFWTVSYGITGTLKFFYSNFWIDLERITLDFYPKAEFLQGLFKKLEILIIPMTSPLLKNRNQELFNPTSAHL